MSDTSKKSVSKRPAKKAAPRPVLEPPDFTSYRAKLIENEDGDTVFCEPVWRFRFLFGDGTVKDVVAIRDDSRLRELLLAERKGVKNDRIAGSATAAFVGYAKLTDLLDD